MTVAMTSFMEMALQEARGAGERGEVPVGCVLVRGGEVIARAGNRTVADRDPTAHAEMIVIREAARALGSSGSMTAIFMSRSNRARCAQRQSRSPGSAASITAPPIPKAGRSRTA